MRAGLPARSALAAAMLAALTACSISTRSSQRYAGNLAATSSACPSLQSTLVVQDRRALFAPGDGTWVLDGQAVGSHLALARSRPSFDGKTYATKLDATVDDAAVVGTYTTPSCTYAVRLDRF